MKINPLATIGLAAALTATSGCGDQPPMTPEEAARRAENGRDYVTAALGQRNLNEIERLTEQSAQAARHILGDSAEAKDLSGAVEKMTGAAKEKQAIVDAALAQLDKTSPILAADARKWKIKNNNQGDVAREEGQLQEQMNNVHLAPEVDSKQILGTPGAWDYARLQTGNLLRSNDGRIGLILGILSAFTAGALLRLRKVSRLADAADRQALIKELTESKKNALALEGDLKTLKDSLGQAGAPDDTAQAAALRVRIDELLAQLAAANEALGTVQQKLEASYNKNDADRVTRQAAVNEANAKIRDLEVLVARLQGELAARINGADAVTADTETEGKEETSQTAPVIPADPVVPAPVAPQTPDVEPEPQSPVQGADTSATEPTAQAEGGEPATAPGEQVTPPTGDVKDALDSLLGDGEDHGDAVSENELRAGDKVDDRCRRDCRAKLLSLTQSILADKALAIPVHGGRIVVWNSIRAAGRTLARIDAQTAANAALLDRSEAEDLTKQAAEGVDFADLENEKIEKGEFLLLVGGKQEEDDKAAAKIVALAEDQLVRTTVDAPVTSMTLFNVFRHLEEVARGQARV